MAANPKTPQTVASNESSERLLCPPTLKAKPRPKGFTCRYVSLPNTCTLSFAPPGLRCVKAKQKRCVARARARARLRESQADAVDVMVPSPAVKLLARQFSAESARHRAVWRPT